MTPLARPGSAPAEPAFSPGRMAVAAMLGLAAAMGGGRFVFTPLLPVMAEQAGMSAQQGAYVATANYAGYLIGALVLSYNGRLNTRSTAAVSALILVTTELLMPVTLDVGPWMALRLIAGIASAVLFVSCATATEVSWAPPWVRGVTFGGVGLGIALTGLGVLVAPATWNWQALWLGASLLTALLAVPLVFAPHPQWAPLRQRDSEVAESAVDFDPAFRRPAPTPSETPHKHAWRLLATTYFLEGVGYIIIGTFLVDAVGHGGPGVGPLVWTMVGLAALPAPLLWSAAGARLQMRRVIVAAFALQAFGAVIPVVFQGTGWALLAAALFGGTFMPICMLMIALGTHLGVPRSAAKLTAAFASGQTLGPLVIAPALGDGYTVAFAASGGILVVATATAFAFSRVAPRR